VSNTSESSGIDLLITLSMGSSRYRRIDLVRTAWKTENLGKGHISGNIVLTKAANEVTRYGLFQKQVNEKHLASRDAARTEGG
jgi:hypothetical protein